MSIRKCINSLFLASVIVVSQIMLVTVTDHRRMIKSVVSDCAESVVYIEAGNDQGRWSGSGVIVSEDGTVFTAKHVVKDADWISVILFNGDECPVTGVVLLQDADAAIVYIEATGLKAAKVGNSDRLDFGDYVIAIGHPYGLQYSVSLGIVSNPVRELEGDFFGTVTLIQGDVQTNPGNSGCPIFNLKGEVVGIVVGGIYGSDGISFSVPSNIFLEALGEI